MLLSAMRARVIATILALAAVSAMPAPGRGQTVADLVREASPQVVRVRVGPPGPPPSRSTATEERCRREPRGSASGFIVATSATRPLDIGFNVPNRPAGDLTSIYILTNNHVANPCPTDWPRVALRVQFAGEGTEFTATRVGADPQTDLAVIRVERLRNIAVFFNRPLKFAPGVAVGEDVVAIGFALGQEGGPTVTKGIVSAVGRSLAGKYSDLVQMDATIHHGNSGGPLLNMRGEVVGVNSFGREELLYYAVSSRVASRVSSELLSRGTVTRGQLGFRSVVSVSDDVVERMGSSQGPALERGALLVDLIPGGPLALAGLRRCDLIQQVEGYPIHNEGELLNALLFLAPGSTVKVQYRRYPPTVCEAPRVGGSLSARLVQLTGTATNHTASLVLGGVVRSTLPGLR
jgi:S1-C subfamily serine protease